MQIDEHDALIVVDVQNDFLPGGSLGVPGGEEIIPVITKLLPLFRHRVYTRDWHPPDHMSFSEQPEFRDGSWPIHAVRGTWGARFHPDLPVPDDALIVDKATSPDREEYSGFRATGIDLAGWLAERGVRRVFVVGLATDYCVRQTALDAAELGFDVYVVEDAVRGVAEDTVSASWEELERAGVRRVRSEALHA